MPDGTKLRKAELRGHRVGRDDPRRGRAGDRHRARRDHRARRRRADARDAARRRCCRSRPTCWCSRSRPTVPTASGSTASPGRCTPPPSAPLSAPPWDDDAQPGGEVGEVTIDVECPDLCPRFTARVFEDVKIGPSPPWLKARLMAAGQRPISNVVDITNYVMLLTGQPLHAFDLDRVAGATADRPPGRGRRGHRDARRPDADARPRDGADRGRRRADLDRRRDGRRPLGGRAGRRPAC